jgi:hypothetical protein
MSSVNLFKYLIKYFLSIMSVTIYFSPYEFQDYRRKIKRLVDHYEKQLKKSNLSMSEMFRIIVDLMIEHLDELEKRGKV